MYIDLGLTSAALVGLLSAILTGAGLFLAWRQARERQLRKDDVLKWSLEVIRTLQTLYLASYLGDRAFDPAEAKALRQKIALDTSVLVEQGRLFFKNQPDAEHGKDKPEAYRGHRPELLDPIVVAHQIACQWAEADEVSRRRMILAAEDAVKRFVSLAQKEVGRSETATEETAKGGTGDDLRAVMAAIGEKRLETLAASQRNSL